MRRSAGGGRPAAARRRRATAAILASLAAGCGRDEGRPVALVALADVAAAEAAAREDGGDRRGGRRPPATAVRREDGGAAVVEIAAGAHVDLLARWVEGAALAGRVVAAPGPATRSVAVRVERTTEDGATRTLVARELAPGSGHDLAAPLAPWEGVARFRFRVLAPGDGGAAGGGSARWIGVDLRASGPPAAAAPAAGPPPHGLAGRDLVVVLLDAARADALGCYGGEAATPALDGLAARGTRFLRALTPAPWTLPAVAALFTGLDADAVGVESWGAALPPGIPNLAERLAGAGYDTVAWSQHPLYLNHRSLGRGFARLEVTPRDAPYALPSASDLFASPRPTFAWIHLLPPHAPYEPPPPFRGSRSGWFRGALDPTPGVLRQAAVRAGREPLGADEVRYARDRYLENLAWADAMVGDLVAALREAGREEDALVVVLADHGEAFFEHGAFLHTTDLYDEFVRVPWIVRWPRGVTGFAAEVTGTVSTVDLAPTLLAAALGARATGEPGSGRSLLPAVFAGAPPARAAYATTRGVERGAARARRRLALETDGWKAIYDPRGDRLELYRPAADPREQRDLAAERPLVAGWLRQELLLRFAAHRAAARALGSGAAAEELDPEVEERLRALGYL